MLRLIRWLRGFVVFELKGRFPERFINVCARLGIFLLDPIPCDRKIVGSMLLCDYKNIRKIARKCGVVLRIKERHGLPFVLSQYRSRSGLLAGSVAFVAIIIIMQSFVWTIEINGLNTISSVDLTDILRESGVYIGAFKGELDLQGIQRKVMQNVDEIGWMSINIIGTKAEIEIKEKDKKPEIRDVKNPCNIMASKDGVILSMNIKKGKAVVPVGSAVKKGQLLVSGVVENSLQKIDFFHSDAQITAKTTRSMDFKRERRGEYKQVTDVAVRHRFDLLWFRVPVTFKPVRREYCTEIVSKKLNLNNTYVPCGLTSQHCTIYKNTEYFFNEKEAEKAVLTEEVLYRLFAFNDCRSVDARISIHHENDVCFLQTTYTCEEEIGIPQNIVVN